MNNMSDGTVEAYSEFMITSSERAVQLKRNSRYVIYIFFYHGATALVGQGLIIIEDL
jgi:hypothetical protein